MCFTDDFKKLNSADKAMRNKYLSYVKSSAVNSELEQTNKFSLQMFYTAELENITVKNRIALSLQTLKTTMYICTVCFTKITFRYF